MDHRNSDGGPGAASTRGAPRSGACAIAPVRGDVTTVRAAEAVRRRAADRHAPARRAGAAADAFPCRLSDVGPA